MSLNRMFRPACSRCNNRSLKWMPILDLVLQLPTAEQREHAREAVMTFGTEGEAWLCPDAGCAEWGVFGPVEMSH